MRGPALNTMASKCVLSIALRAWASRSRRAGVDCLSRGRRRDGTGDWGLGTGHRTGRDKHSPVLLQVVLPFETLAADLAREGELRRLVRPLVNHQVVGLGETALAVFTDVLAFGSHLSHAELPAAIFVLDLHYGEHDAGCLSLSARGSASLGCCVTRRSYQSSPAITPATRGHITTNCNPPHRTMAGRVAISIRSADLSIRGMPGCA